MKQLISILSILLLSCSQNKFDFESIEIMSYYYHYDDKSNIILDRVFYSYINPNGLSQTIRKTNSSEKEIYYESKINPEILNRIISETKNKNENDFKKEKDSSNIRLYCGPIIRFRLIKKNSNTLSFTFEEDNSLKKYSPFYNLHKKLINDSLNIRYKDRSFTSRQKEFEKFVIHRDTTELIVPPPPRINQIKFIKPQIHKKHK